MSDSASRRRGRRAPHIDADSKAAERLTDRLVKLWREFKRLGMLVHDRGMIVTLSERDGLRLELMAVRYTGSSAHVWPGGEALRPMADGHIRRFRIGYVELRYRVTSPELLDAE